MASQPLRMEIKLEGDEAMKLALAAGFSERALKRFDNTATLNAARTLVPPMKAAAPSRTGKLSKAIGARRSRNRGGGAVVGIRRGKTGVWYRWPAVDAAAPHTILAKGGGILAFAGIRTRAVEHPGKPANNFVTDAALSNLQKAFDAYAKTIAKLMTDQEFRKRVKGLAAKYPRR